MPIQKGEKVTRGPVAGVWWVMAKLKECDDSYPDIFFVIL